MNTPTQRPNDTNLQPPLDTNVPFLDDKSDAISVVEYGIPAVVGMRFEISDEAAITFADRLYNAIAQGFPIDAAMAAVASDAQAVVHAEP